ncbi:MAG: hypothetical protein GF393_12995, partial [Armatimonadia bacterium]|nr:hypothetical protein [Armatimonadia bacterium]
MSMQSKQFLQEFIEKMRASYAPAPPMADRISGAMSGRGLGMPSAQRFTGAERVPPGGAPMRSGVYTGMGADGRPQRVNPVQERVAHNKQPYAVDEHELLVTDAQTLQDYGGPVQLDRFIQQNRPQGEPHGQVPMGSRSPAPPERAAPQMYCGGVPGRRQYYSGGIPGRTDDPTEDVADQISVSSGNVPGTGERTPPPKLPEPAQVKPVLPDAGRLDKAIMDRYTSRMGAMQAAERGAEAQTLRQQGLGAPEIRGTQAVSDVSRRSALGDTVATMGIDAMGRADTRRSQMREFSESRRRFDEQMDLQKQQYGDNKAYQDFVNAAEYGDDATVASAYENYFGRPLEDSAMVNDIRDWARRQGEAGTQEVETRVDTMKKSQKWQEYQTAIAAGDYDTAASLYKEVTGKDLDVTAYNEDRAYLTEMRDIEKQGAQERLQQLKNSSRWDEYERALQAQDYDTAAAIYKEVTGKDIDMTALKQDREYMIKSRDLTYASAKESLTSQQWGNLQAMIDSGADYDTVARYLENSGLSAEPSPERFVDSYYSAMPELSMGDQFAISADVEQSILNREAGEAMSDYLDRVRRELQQAGVSERGVNRIVDSLQTVAEGSGAKQLYSSMRGLYNLKMDSLELANDAARVSLDAQKFESVYKKIASGATFDQVKSELMAGGATESQAHASFARMSSKYELEVASEKLRLESVELGLDEQGYAFVHKMISEGAPFEAVSAYMESVGVSVGGSTEQELQNAMTKIIRGLDSETGAFIQQLVDVEGLNTLLPDETTDQYIQRVRDRLSAYGNIPKDVVWKIDDALRYEAKRGEQRVTEWYDSMKRLSYGKGEQLEAAEALLNAGGEANIRKAAAIFNETYPGLGIDFENIITEERDSDFADGMSQMTQFAATFTYFDEAWDSIDQAGIADKMGFSSGEAKKALKGIFNQMRLVQDPLYQWTHAISDTSLETLFPEISATKARQAIARIGAFGAVTFTADGRLAIDYDLLSDLFGEGFADWESTVPEKNSALAFDEFYDSIPGPLRENKTAAQWHSDWLSSNKPSDYDTYITPDTEALSGIISEALDLREGQNPISGDISVLEKSHPKVYKSVTTPKSGETVEQWMERARRELAGSGAGIDSKEIENFVQHVAGEMGHGSPSGAEKAEIDRVTGVANNLLTDYGGLADIPEIGKDDDRNAVIGTVPNESLEVARMVATGQLPKELVTKLTVSGDVSGKTFEYNWDRRTNENECELSATGKAWLKN